MIIYFADRNQNVMGQASTGLPYGLIVIDDTKTEDIETGVASFEVVISYKPEDRLDLEQMTEAGNYVFRSSGNDAECYTIIDAETDSKAKERRLYCEDAGLELLNIVCDAYEADSAHNIAWYINLFAGSSGFEIGTNEIPSKTRTLKWDGEATGTERIRSIATQFDNAEISYRFVIENMEITHRYIDIWEKRGVDIQQQLRIDRDIDNIVVKRSVANLITAVFATGSTLDGEDEPLDLIGAAAYDDGDIYLDRQTGILYSRNGVGRWARPNGAYIVGRYSYETESQEELKNRAIAHLKRLSDVEVNYEVDIVRGLENTHIGDRVNIVDDLGEVYVSGRILKLDTSVTRGKKQATLGEYLIKSSGLSEQVLALADRFQSAFDATQALANSVHVIAETVDSMFTLEVQSNVNYTANTAELKAHLYHGDKEVTTDYTEAQFKWILRKETGEYLLHRGYTYTADLEQVGYAGTILCRFIRPELYDLTDHNLITITDHEGNPIQVSFAGLFSQPVVRRASKFRALNKASNTTNVMTGAPEETGYPTLAREVNLYEHEGLAKRLDPIVQHFWTDDDGAHITEVPKDDFLENPAASGGNLLARSRGLYLRKGENTLASFEGNEIRLGDYATSAKITFCNNEAELKKNTNFRQGREVPATLLMTTPSGTESVMMIEAQSNNERIGYAGSHFYNYEDESTAILTANRNNITASFSAAVNDEKRYTSMALTGDVLNPSFALVKKATGVEANFNFIDSFTSPVALTVVSDKRLKDHISYLGEDACDFIRKLKPTKYKKDNQIHTGFYAQEVEEVNNLGTDITPKAIAMEEGKEEYYGLVYEELIAPLVAYCQALEKRIEALEQEVK